MALPFHIHFIAHPHLTRDHVRCCGFSRLGAELCQTVSRFEQRLRLIAILLDDALDRLLVASASPSLLIAVRHPKERFHRD